MKLRATLFSAITILLFMSFSLQAQQAKKPRASLNASVSQTIGVATNISITYSRPGVKGRKIWGDLVPYGMAEGNKYSNNKPYPWRGGANENTTIEFSKDVTVDGNKIPAGKYGMHFIPGEKEWVIIFSKTNDAWGSFTYDEKNDQLRIKVKPEEAPFKEWLEYGFDNLAGTSCTAFLHWEKLRVPFTIATAE